MNRFRYTSADPWYKGNTHIHSTASDGGWTFGELAGAYAGAGYDFLFRTDHWVTSEAAADPEPYPLLWLDGVELDGFDTQGSYYHVVCLGTFDGLDREQGFPAAFERARDQGGLMILAHPLWTGNSFEEACRWDFHGVEVYNHVCRWLNGKGDGLSYWQAMLRVKPGTLAFASDDAHTRPSHPGWNGGWVMVQAPELTPHAILGSLRAGRFYSTTGPNFRQIVCDGQSVSAKTSPVRFMRLVGPAYLGQRIGSFDGTLLEEGAFEIPRDWPYAYLEIEDAVGRRAWTNTLRSPETGGQDG
ncbi:MAG: PHP domain-containing protein [Anaerolineae bacterium]